MSVFGGYKGHWEPTEAVEATAESYLKAAGAALDSIKMPDLALFKNLKVFVGSEHKHYAQKPKTINIKEHI